MTISHACEEPVTRLPIGAQEYHVGVVNWGFSKYLKGFGCPASLGSFEKYQPYSLLQLEKLIIVCLEPCPDIMPMTTYLTLNSTPNGFLCMHFPNPQEFICSLSCRQLMSS